MGAGGGLLRRQRVRAGGRRLQHSLTTRYGERRLPAASKLSERPDFARGRPSTLSRRAEALAPSTPEKRARASGLDAVAVHILHLQVCAAPLWAVWNDSLPCLQT